MKKKSYKIKRLPKNGEILEITKKYNLNYINTYLYFRNSIDKDYFSNQSKLFPILKKEGFIGEENINYYYQYYQLDKKKIIKEFKFLYNFATEKKINRTTFKRYCVAGISNKSSNFHKLEDYLIKENDDN